MSRRALRLALWQCDPLPLQVDANLERLAQAASCAAAAGAQMIVTPEMFLTGYDIGAREASSLAEMPGGPRAAAVAAIAQRAGIAIVTGHPERDAEGRVFNTALCIDAGGRCIARHRKSHLFGELDGSMFTPGAADEPAFEWLGWTVGLLICYDVEFPENARRLALAGADLIVVPTANMADFDFVATHLVPVRAYENQVYVAYTNYCGVEGTLRYGGLSSLAAPDGSAQPRAGRSEALLTVELTPACLEQARLLNRHVEVCRARLARESGG